MTTTSSMTAAALVSSSAASRASANGGRVLTQASNQWASRPADQRFSSLDDLHAAVMHHKEVAVEARGVDLRQLRVTAATGQNDDGTVSQYPTLIGASGTVANFTHHSFGQIARRIGAPANYLRSLPAELVAENMNHGLARCDAGDNDALLFSQNGSLTLRAALSNDYQRIWNSDITSRLIRLTEEHPEWQPAPAAFDGSRGLYASDADVFAFMVDNDRRIFERGPAGGLGRGFFVSNTEVGGTAFKFTTFLYEYVCGNHRVWGASGVQELSIRHVGNADDKAFAELAIELRKYADSSAEADELKVMRAQSTLLGENKEAVLDRVFGLRMRDLGRKLIEQSYNVAEQHSDWYGDPKSVWGLTGGMTQVARDLPNASDRVALERAAGKVMQIAF